MANPIEQKSWFARIALRLRGRRSHTPAPSESSTKEEPQDVSSNICRNLIMKYQTTLMLRTEQIFLLRTECHSRKRGATGRVRPQSWFSNVMFKFRRS